MIIAIYLPDELAEQFKADRLQGSLHRLRLLARHWQGLGSILSTDVKLMQQLECSFCVAREIDKKNDILIDHNDPTRGGIR